MILKRTFHPVGHGAFYTEQFYSTASSLPCFTVVFDCGRFEAAKKGCSFKQYKDAIESYVSSSDSGLILGQKIDVLFISHFHTDHILGVEFLLKNYNVEKIIIPAITIETILDSLSTSYEDDNYAEVISFFGKVNRDYGDKVCMVDIQDSRLSDEDTEEIDLQREDFSSRSSLNKCTRLKYRGWYYKPYYKVDRTNEKNLIAKLRAKFPGTISGSEIDPTQIIELIKTNGVDSLKDVYASVFGKDKHNSYSLTLYSGMSCDKACHKGCHMKANDDAVNFQLCSCNCLYMGDYEALGDKQRQIMTYYSREWGNIGIVQVPHHGSEHNSDDAFYHGKKRLCIISADSNDKYEHPDQVVLDAIANSYSIPILITENKKTKLCFTIQIPN